MPCTWLLVTDTVIDHLDSPSCFGLYSLSIPARSKPWVRVYRASLALLPQPPRQNKSSTGADVRCAQARPRPWRADAQYEGRWASWLLVLARAAIVPVASNPVGNLVH